MEKQTPFKEKTDHQLFLNEKGNWEECDESTISKLWHKWVVSPNAKAQYLDKEGYLVFEFN